MHRALLIGALLMTFGLVASAPTVAADGMCGTALPGGAHIEHVCIDEERCLDNGLCANAADPRGTAKNAITWAESLLG